MNRIRSHSVAVLLPAVLFAAAFSYMAHAAYLSFVSDLIVASAPSEFTSHTIQFTAPGGIPVSGDISITPQDGAFTIPAGTDYTNVHFSVWNGSFYAPRSLAASPSATDDGVTVVTGTSGSITITLSSGAGVNAGGKVRIVIDSIQNPATDGSFRIELATHTAGGVKIDDLSDIVAIIKPVGLSSFITLAYPEITNALPSGAIAANNPVVELSFNTDTFSNCRYSLTPGVPYGSMTDSFPQVNAQLFYLTLTGFQNNTTYHYYIRCVSTQGAVNADDYDLTFTLGPDPVSDTSVANSSGGGGGAGSGPFPNGSQVLYQSSVTLSGYTAPGSTVEVLRDGVKVLATQAQGSGSFTANLTNIERGTYTFTVYSVDQSQRKSAPYASTITLGSATNNNISGILLAPNISLESDSVAVGAAATAEGSAPPNSLVEVLFSLKGGSVAPRTYTASSSVSGAWSVTTKSGDLSTGTYVVKARTTFGASQSDYSVPLYLGVGQAPVVTGGACGNSDINGDKKVNLVDFSILLSGWGTSAANTDLNCDGNTNLADFSILLFNWTG